MGECKRFRYLSHQQESKAQTIYYSHVKSMEFHQSPLVIVVVFVVAVVVVVAAAAVATAAVVVAVDVVV